MIDLTIVSWSQFLEIANRLDVGPAPVRPYAFRGHGEATWELQPSLLRALRTLNATEAQALYLEERTIAEFRAQAHLHVPPNVFTTTTDIVSWLTLMQHHGAPTRLLDWSRSVFVAAYFAVIDCPDADGAIWVVHIESLHAKMQQTHGDVGFPKNEKAIREKFMQPNAPLVVTFVERKNRSDRMIAQQGTFSICQNVLGHHGHIMADALQGTDDNLHFAKLIIPARLKLSFLRKLRSMNITANALFPGLDGVARSVGELLRLGLTN